jgi:hypothetical protein
VVGSHFADKRRSIGRYSSLADSDHGVCFVFCIPFRGNFMYMINTVFIHKILCI